MAKISNWSRAKRRESSKRQRDLPGFTYKPYVWYHEGRQEYVTVKEIENGWRVDYPGSQRGKEFGTKEEARKWAVKWMKKHS